MPTMDETRSALEAGATRQELLTAGYPGSSITKAVKQLKKAGAGDARRRPRVQPANLVPAVRAITPVLPAPSDELTDKRESLQLRQLDNALLVEGQKSERLQPEKPEPPKPPTEIENAREVVGLLGDLKSLYPAPEPSSQTPAAGDSKLSSGQLLELDIKRLEMEERNEVRLQDRELQQVEKKAELIQEIGGHFSRGLAGFLKVLQEVHQVAPARRQPVELNPSPGPSQPSSEGDMRVRQYLVDGGIQTEDSDGSSTWERLPSPGEDVSQLSISERRRLGLLNIRPPVVQVQPVAGPPQKSRFFTGRRTWPGSP